MAVILLFNLIDWLPSPIVIEATAAITDCQDLSSIGMSFNAYPGETIKKNYTKIIDFDNGFSNITELESLFNFTNALVSKDQFKNKTSFLSDITTNQTIGTTGSSSPEIIADFNRDGFDDQAIGVPGFDLTVSDDVGAVIVIYGSFPFGLSASGTAVRPAQLLTQGWGLPSGPDDQDHFGWSLSSGDYNRDGFSDLAVGVPGEDYKVGNETFASDAGMIHVIYGSPQGLSNHVVRDDQIWYQDPNNCLLADHAENFDHFGWSLSSADYDGDTRHDLAVGVPGEDVNDVNAHPTEDAGAVHVIYGSSNGLASSDPVGTDMRPEQLWTQTSIDIRKGDAFGSSLSSGEYNGDGRDDLAIGAPLEDIDLVETDAGQVNVIYGSPHGLSSSAVLPIQILTQNSADIQDNAEGLDYFGWSLSSGNYNNDTRDDLAIGAPGEALSNNTINFVGKVHVIYGSSSGLSSTLTRDDQLWMQGDDGLDEVAEENDYFGWSLSSGDHNGDGPDDLAIGVPYEDIIRNQTRSLDAGAVHVIYGSSSGLSSTLTRDDQLFRQGFDGVNGGTLVDNQFGWILSSGDHNGDRRDDLAIGVPWSDVGGASDEGNIQVIHGLSSGLSATTPPVDSFLIQGAGGVPPCPGCGEPDDHFGWSLS